MFANYHQRVQKDIFTVIKRQLPGKGKIKISAGWEVTPSDILGESETTAGFRSINLAKELECDSSEVKKYLKVAIGKAIYRGELLAEKPGGFFGKNKQFLAPDDGIVEFYDEKRGELRLRFLPQKKNFPSGVFGIVEEVDNSKGEVWIKAQATEITGLLGSGRAREGTLTIVGGRGDLTNESRINSNHRDHILVCGGIVYINALEKAILLKLRGLISGGMNVDEFKSISSKRIKREKRIGSDVGVSIMICEGFGSIPIGWDIFDILVKYNNHFAVLDGNRAKLLLPSLSADSILALRKIYIPKSVIRDRGEEDEVEQLQIGLQIRVISQPYMGEQGKIVGLDRTPTLLPSGISTYLVTIEGRSRKLRVPYTNLEII